jgi:multicomponent Na+:H+ antiporter subunit D
MIYHPTTVILAFISILLASYHQERIFKIAAFLMPIIAAILFSMSPSFYSVEMFNITFSYKLDYITRLISLAFIVVLLVANLSALSNNRKKDLLLGSGYAAGAFLCLCANDFISMITGLEVMTVLSALLIFIGGIRSSLRSAKKYFLTHLISSSMIIIGSTHLIIKNNSLELISITELLNQSNCSALPLYLILAGSIINIAAFPFSGWMVNYYPKASPTGFLYLISFTTKVSIVLMIKLFAGYEPLKYIAIIMMIYASLKAIFEDNLFSIVCYLSIISMGFMLLAISNGSEFALIATATYLFIDIIYKLLLSTSVSIIIDQGKIHDASDLKQIKDKNILIGLGVSIIMVMNLPLMTSFYAKTYIANLFPDYLSYFAILFSSFMSILVIPWKQYFSSKKSFSFQISRYAKIIIFMLISIILSIRPIASYLSLLSELKTEMTYQDIIKQFAIIIFALIIGFSWKTKRIITKPINLIESIGNIFFYFYHRYNKQPLEKNRETLSIKPLEQQFLRKSRVWHNQQTAIFIVFTVFVIILALLIKLP